MRRRVARVSGSSSEPGEDQAAASARSVLGLLEQPRVVALHVSGCGDLGGRGLASLRKPAEAATQRRSSSSDRAGVSCVCSSSSICSAVLELAQDAVGVLHLVARPRRDPVLRRPGRRGCRGCGCSAAPGRGRRGSSCWVCTKNSISRMPPRPSLRLWPGDRDLAMDLLGVDLPLHRMDVGDGGEVEIFAPDEGLHAVEELRAGAGIAGARRAP